MKQLKKQFLAFTLVEIMVGIFITTSIVITAFQVVSYLSIGKVKLIESSDIEKQAFFTAQKLFEEIKKGGSLDYEEYWNISNSLDLSVAGNYQSGHILDSKRGFGNYGKAGTYGTTTYGENYYYCLSNGGNAYSGGCISGLNISEDGSSGSLNQNRYKNPQRYGQYAFQFFDFNSDNDSDNGDEDSSGEATLKFYGDDDDMDLGKGPSSFSGNLVPELYLISYDGTKRVFYRYSVGPDPHAPSGATCTNGTGSGCLGTIEVLKLQGDDQGFSHAGAGAGFQDGKIDTWYIDPDFAGTAGIVAGSNSTNYWQKIIPDSLNVSDFEVYMYPDKNPKYSWNDGDPASQIDPYIQIKISLSPSWKEKKKIKGAIPQVDLISTLSFSSLDIR